LGKRESGNFQRLLAVILTTVMHGRIMAPPQKKGLVVKPLWGLAGVALLGVAGVAGVVIVASSGGGEEVVQQVETATPAAEGDGPPPSLTPGPGVTLWRWMNVSVLIPDGSDITFGPQPIYLDAEGTQSRQGVSFGKADPERPDVYSQIVLDAENGTIFSERILDTHRSEMEQVRGTIAVGALDRGTAPWPYNGDPPQDATREAAFGISFIRPDPATGIIVEYVLNSFSGGGSTPADCEVLADTIGLRNGRSSAFIGLDARTGSLCKDFSEVLPDDAVAFERYSASVHVQEAQ
jgi:hypothetical protein